MNKELKKIELTACTTVLSKDVPSVHAYHLFVINEYVCDT